MFKVIRKLIYVLAVFLMVFPLVSCGGSGSSGTAGGTTGTLGIGLTDATTDQYQAIYVTIGEIQVKQGIDDGEAGWMTVLTPGQTFNLLELVNGAIEELGLAELEAGQYGQLRLILGELPEIPGTNILGNDHPYANYLINTAGDEIELKVPSGYQTGIKIVRGFTIVAGASEATRLILDFDAARSVVQAGKSGKWLLKPTIKVLDTVYNSVSGVVDDGVDPVAGALVSAQIYDSLAADPRDEVMIEGGTVSNDDVLENYFMYLPPDTYNIVATMEGYMPQCLVVPATGYLDYTANFTLTAAVTTGTMTGSVIGLVAVDGSALFSIRQADAGCGMIELVSFSVANGATSAPVILPDGTYEVVVSAEGEVTQVFDVDVAVDADTLLSVDFTPAP